MQDNLCIAALQMNSGDDVTANLQQAADLIAAACAQGADVVMLPEAFAFMGSRRDRQAVTEADGDDGPVQAFLAAQARRHNVWLIGGTHPLRDPDSAERSFAACLVYDGRGQRVARYDKLYLFDVDLPDSGEHFHESAFTRPGESTCVIDLGVTRLGLSVCYDMRFPELYRHLVTQGAEIFAVPSAFTARTGGAHWSLLLRARAVENLAAVVAPAQVGTHPRGRETWGHSLIVGPWGECLAQTEHPSAGVVIANIDLSGLRELRRTFPVLSHRRTELS